MIHVLLLLLPLSTRVHTYAAAKCIKYLIILKASVYFFLSLLWMDLFSHSCHHITPHLCSTSPWCSWPTALPQSFAHLLMVITFKGNQFAEKAAYNLLIISIFRAFFILSHSRSTFFLHLHYGQSTKERWTRMVRTVIWGKIANGMGWRMHEKNWIRRQKRCMNDDVALPSSNRWVRLVKFWSELLIKLAQAANGAQDENDNRITLPMACKWSLLADACVRATLARMCVDFYLRVSSGLVDLTLKWPIRCPHDFSSFVRLSQCAHFRICH